jgi:hypothetical protein
MVCPFVRCDIGHIARCGVYANCLLSSISYNFFYAFVPRGKESNLSHFLQKPSTLSISTSDRLLSSSGSHETTVDSRWIDQCEFSYPQSRVLSFNQIDYSTDRYDLPLFTTCIVHSLASHTNRPVLSPLFVYRLFITITFMEDFGTNSG